MIPIAEHLGIIPEEEFGRRLEIRAIEVALSP